MCAQGAFWQTFTEPRSTYRRLEEEKIRACYSWGVLGFLHFVGLLIQSATPPPQGILHEGDRCRMSS